GRKGFIAGDTEAPTAEGDVAIAARTCRHVQVAPDGVNAAALDKDASGGIGDVLRAHGQRAAVERVNSKTAAAVADDQIVRLIGAPVLGEIAKAGFADVFVGLDVQDPAAAQGICSAAGESIAEIK